MIKILVFGAGSDLICELIKKIYNTNKEASFTLISSSSSIKKKYSFLKGSAVFLNINYKDDLEQKLSVILKSQYFNDIYIANGYLPTSNNMSEINKSLQINYVIPHKLINMIINIYKEQRFRIIYFSSPASDRPRKSNYIYGSHKALVDFTINGLRLLNPKISFVIVKPGPTETKMTKNYLGFKHKQNTVVKSLYWQLKFGMKDIYAPIYWKLIMIIIKLIPNRIFKFINF